MLKNIKKIAHEYSMRITYIYIYIDIFIYYKLIILLIFSYNHVKIIKTLFFETWFLYYDKFYFKTTYY